MWTLETYQTLLKNQIVNFISTQPKAVPSRSGYCLRFSFLLLFKNVGKKQFDTSRRIFYFTARKSPFLPVW